MPILGMGRVRCIYVGSRRVCKVRAMLDRFKSWISVTLTASSTRYLVVCFLCDDSVLKDQLGYLQG